MRTVEATGAICAISTGLTPFLPSEPGAGRQEEANAKDLPSGGYLLGGGDISIAQRFPSLPHWLCSVRSDYPMEVK